MGVLAEEAGGGERSRGSAMKEKVEQEQDGQGGHGMHLFTCSSGRVQERRTKWRKNVRDLAGKQNGEGTHPQSKNVFPQRLRCRRWLGFVVVPSLGQDKNSSSSSSSYSITAMARG